jgi:hypothetical protein
MGMSGRLLRPRATGFTPRSISGLAAWLDAADASTVTVGTGVSQWTDKSGNAVNALQGTANNQPAYQVSVFNGKNAIYFDGTDDDLATAANAAINVTELTLLVVFRGDAASNDGVVTKSGLTLDPNGFGLYTRSTPEIWFQGDDTEQAHCTRGGAYTNLSLAVLRGTATAQSVRLNGAEATPSAVATSYAANRPLRIGTRRAGVEFFTGYVCEVLLYNRVISTGQETALRDSLKAKWGLTAV